MTEDFSFGAHIDFTFRWPYGGTQVVVAGAWDNWAGRTALVRGADGTWEARMHLPARTYQYKFVVDGQWCYDVRRPTAGDDRGNVNNVLDGPFLLGAAAAKELERKTLACAAERDPAAGAIAKTKFAYLGFSRFGGDCAEHYPWHGEWELALNKPEQVVERGRWGFTAVGAQRCKMAFEGAGVRHFGISTAVYDRQSFQLSTNAGLVFSRHL